MKAIGVDIGGHGVKAGVVEHGSETVDQLTQLDYEAVRNNRSIPKRDVPGDQIIAATLQVIDQLIASAPDVSHIGLACAGTIDSTRGIVIDGQGQNYVGTNWSEVLTQHLGSQFHFAVENDANAAGWAEFRLWNGKPPTSLIHLIVGSGIGAGLVINGRIVTGANFVTGEFGMLPFRDSTIEGYAGSPGLLARSGCASLVDLAKGLQAGEPQCSQAIALGADALAYGVAAIINILGPEVIVFGGGTGTLLPTYQTLTEERIATIATREAFAGVTFATDTLGNNAGIVGAAHLAMDAS